MDVGGRWKNAVRAFPVGDDEMQADDIGRAKR